MTDQEHRLFRRLDVLVGGFTLEAAEAVLTSVDVDLDAVIYGIAFLVVQSLLRQKRSPNAEPRYRLLATVQAFGLQQLTMTDTEAHTHDAHAAQVLDLAEQDTPPLITPFPSYAHTWRRM